MGYAAKLADQVLRQGALVDAPNGAVDASRISVVDVLVLDIAIFKMVYDCLVQFGALYDLGVNHHAG